MCLCIWEGLVWKSEADSLPIKRLLSLYVLLKHTDFSPPAFYERSTEQQGWTWKSKALSNLAETKTKGKAITLGYLQASETALLSV